MNSKYYHFTYFDGTFDSNEKYSIPNEYVELEDDRQEFDEFLNNKFSYNDDNIKDIQNENVAYDHNEILEETCNDFDDRNHFDDVDEVKDAKNCEDNHLENIGQEYNDDGDDFDDDVHSYVSDDENCVKGKCINRNSCKIRQFCNQEPILMNEIQVTF